MLGKGLTLLDTLKLSSLSFFNLTKKLITLNTKIEFSKSSSLKLSVLYVNVFKILLGFIFLKNKNNINVVIIVRRWSHWMPKVYSNSCLLDIFPWTFLLLVITFSTEGTKTLGLFIRREVKSPSLFKLTILGIDFSLLRFRVV